MKIQNRNILIKLISITYHSASHWITKDLSLMMAPSSSSFNVSPFTKGKETVLNSFPLAWANIIPFRYAVTLNVLECQQFPNTNVAFPDPLKLTLTWPTPCPACNPNQPSSPHLSVAHVMSWWDPWNIHPFFFIIVSFPIWDREESGQPPFSKSAIKNKHLPCHFSLLLVNSDAY